MGGDGMTNKEIINEIKCLLSELDNGEDAVSYLTQNDVKWLNENIKALEPKPYEKFESVKDHIYKLAGDYKCWDNRLTDDEALELCHILEQQPCEDKIIEWKKDFKEYVNSLSMPRDDYKGIMEYIDELPSVTPQQPCEDCISGQAAINIASGFCHPANIVKELKRLPPVQPKQRTGHWIKITPSGIYMCSECEQNVLTGDIDVYHYCHHCGIKMINVIDKYKAENKERKVSDIEKRKPCINYEDGCEEWAGCPCVYYKAGK
jgi:DNA-directed RNA polymerase subunit RPC12/RpoP